VAADRLKATGQTVAVAESSTGGLISASLLAVPRASIYYLGGSVIYTLKSRRHILRIGRDDVAGLEPMTEQMVVPFAHKAREQVGATWGIAELGIAGPTGVQYDKSAPEIAPGTSVIAVAGPTTLTTKVSTGDDDREGNMWAFAAAALDLLAEACQQT